MNKNNLNVVFAVIFVLGFMFFWESFVMSRYAAPKPKEPTAEQRVASDAAADAVVREVASQPARPAAASDKVAEPDALVSLKMESNEVIFLAKGARVASWKIKEKDHWLELVFPESKRVASPLETFTEVDFAANKVSESQVVFTGRHSSGIEITKTISLLSKPPFHSIALELRNPTDKALAVQTALGWGNGLDKHTVGDPYDKDTVTAENRAVALGPNLKAWRPGFIFGRTVDRVETASHEWVAVDNNHFIAAVVAPEGTSISKIHVKANRDLAPVATAVIEAEIKPGETVRRDYLLYVGPKQNERLEKAGHNLSKAIDFGTFGIIAKWLLAALQFFERITGNFGWAIVVVTFIIQILMFPLTKTSLQHSVRMKGLQPHLKKLQEQHKEDPKRYQIEMMNFYKKNGMKFMGLEGCLPLLLQMPIFLAFYTTLNNAYDLRGAPWILWVNDLALKDPYYVLPILMGAGMFLQQKLSGTVADPAQARMMMLMPIVFTFMFLSMPAGLVLYWTTNSLVTIVIQKILMVRAERNPQPIVT